MLNRTASPANFNCCFMTSSSLRRPELSGFLAYSDDGYRRKHSRIELDPVTSRHASRAPIV
jgi:hypothetical protein